MEGFILFYTYLQGFSLVSVVVRLLLSVLCGGVIGYGRERHGRAAGLRTHILVCLGSAIATLIGHYCISVLELSSDPMRIGAQVLSGIGFLGAGTIISRGRFQVTGLTTAAGLWATASIGLAIGIGFYEAAVLGTFFVVLTMSIVTKLDKTIVKKSHKLRIYAELKNMKWRPHYYIFKSTGEKMREGWVCSVCGKHSHSRKEICDGCNTTMWKVEIR